MRPLTLRYDDDVLDDTRATAGALGVAPSTLEGWRVRGQGPAYIKVSGQVRYRRRDVRAWLDANTHGGPGAA